jgi:hypothetical protein
MLFREPSQSTAETHVGAGRSDDVVVEAVFVRVGQGLTTARLAEILGWELLRTRRALSSLERSVQGRAVTRHRASSGWTLRPRDDILNEMQATLLERQRVASGSTHVSAMRLLLEIVRSERSSGWEQRMGKADRVHLAMLIKSGLVARDGAELRPSEDLRTSLQI